MTGAAQILRDRHAERLDRFVHHPFFASVEDGTISPAARDHYFVAERHFVGAARSVFAYALAKTTDLAAARHLIGILEGLVNAQERLFDHIYSALGLSDPVQHATATRALAGGMIAIARDGSYAEGIAAMSVAEWTYAQVGRRGRWQNSPDPMLRDWFALHAKPEFLAGATWLSDELDRVWRPENNARIDTAFAKAIELEIAFHDEPLRGAT